jgi:hypothetical protein
MEENVPFDSSVIPGERDLLHTAQQDSGPQTRQDVAAARKITLPTRNQTSDRSAPSQSLW